MGTVGQPDFPTRLLQCHDATWPQQSGKVAYGCNGVWQKLKDKATDDCVECLGIAERHDVGTMKRSVVEADCRGTSVGRVDGCLIQVDGHDSARRTNQLSDEQRYVSHPATDIEDAHPRHNSGVLKEMFRSGRQEPRLSN